MIMDNIIQKKLDFKATLRKILLHLCALEHFDPRVLNVERRYPLEALYGRGQQARKTPVVL